MRGSWILLGGIMLAGCDRPVAKPDSALQAAAEAELKAANAGYDQALVAGDAAALGRFYADDFRIIDDDGAIHDKANQIDFMTRKVDLLQANSDEIRVTSLSPGVSLVTGRFAGRYRLDGRESDFAERYTSIWVRDGNVWRLKHEHSSLIPQIAPPVGG